uniref:RNase H type-1 domain-containing protein n=1 Tax=Fagus sylvatica TaxID=28930 RepID=A0A2N9F2H7_FAGSY
MNFCFSSPSKLIFFSTFHNKQTPYFGQSIRALQVSWFANHEGRVLAALVLELTDLPRGVHPYVGAVIQGLRFSLSMGFLDVVMEGPPVHFMSATASVKLENTIEDFWVEDIWFLCQQHRRYLFSTVSTDTNKAAVALAKMGIGRYQHQVWIEEAPVELSGLL